MGIPLHSEIGKGGSVALDRLTELALHRIQLHVSHNTVLLHNKGRQRELLHHITQFCCTTKEDKANYLSPTWFCCTTKEDKANYLSPTWFCCTTKEDKANYLSPTWFCCTTKTKWTTPASGACTQQTKMCQSNWHHWPMNSLSSNPSDVLSYTNNIHTQVSEQTHTAKGFGRSL